MRNLFVMFALFLIFLPVNGLCGENIYTWKDKDGVVNITDQAPPSGAEIIDISPSHRVETEEMWRQREIRQRELEQEKERQLRARKAAEARKRKAAEQGKAEQLRLEQKRIAEEKKKPKKRKGY